MIPRGRRHGKIRHQVSLSLSTCSHPSILPPPILYNFLSPLFPPLPADRSNSSNERTEFQIRRLPAQTGQEDGNQPTRPLHVHLLRQDDGQATQCWHLELQELQEDGGGWGVDGFVGGPFFS